MASILIVQKDYKLSIKQYRWIFVRHVQNLKHFFFKFRLLSSCYFNVRTSQVMMMYMLVRRLKNDPISVFAVNNGQVDKTLKQQSDKPAAWGAVYSVGRSLGQSYVPLPHP